MSKGNNKDRLARVHELAAFDQRIVSSFADAHTSADESNPATEGNRLVVQSFNDSIAQSPNPLLLAGFDEAGRGALAGPVVVGCVHFPLLALGSVSPVESEPCSHFRQAVSDVPLEGDSPAFFNHSMTQSLNDSITPSPCVSLSLRPAFLEDLAGIDDSKRLTARQREALFPRIKSHAVWAIGTASAEEIDKLGIVPAVSLAARRAYRAMGMNVDLLLCDRGIAWGQAPCEQGQARFLARGQARFLASDRARKSACPLSPSIHPPELSFTRGDSRSLHIAAASIIAKVTRDRMMVDLDRGFPGYDFAGHKGYGTTAHLAALRRLGPSAVHRRSFHVK